MEQIHTDMWFRYEQGFNGQWFPVVYRDGKPPKPSGGKEVNASHWIEVEELYLFDGDPIMDTLTSVYPAPRADPNGKSEA